jgi:hypothetical protein
MYHITNVWLSKILFVHLWFFNERAVNIALVITDMGVHMVTNRQMINLKSFIFSGPKDHSW